MLIEKSLFAYDNTEIEALYNKALEKIKSYEKNIEIMDILYEMTKDKNYKKAGRAYKLVLLLEKGIQKL